MENVASTESTGSATTGPTTFAEASWSDAPSASEPATDTAAASASADATVPPAEQMSPDGQPTPANGEPPQERWPDILANARAKEREAALQEWRQKHGWAEQVNPQEFQQIQKIASHFAKGDPIAGLQEMIAEIRKDPQADAALRSLAAKELGRRTAQPQAAPEQEPQPDLPIELADGRVVHVYTAEQQAKREAYLQRQWMQSVQQELQPLKQTHETLQAERAALAQQQEITHFVTTTFQDVRTWPGMDDKANQQAVAHALQGMRLTSDDPREVQIALNTAYRQVVLPKLSQSAEARTLDSLQRKAAASTTVNPGSAAASTPKPVRSFNDLPPEAWR